MPTSIATKPSPATRRGETFGKNLGTPAAASSIVSESGVIRSPVSIAESPSATDRYSGMTKKSPIITTNWKKNISRPPVIWLFANIDGLTSGSAFAASSRRAWIMNRRSDTSPARINHRTGDMPSTDGLPAEGTNQPHSPDFNTPSTTRPMPTAQSSEPSTSKRGRVSGRASATRRERRKIPAPTTTSPANTHRHDA